MRFEGKSVVVTGASSGMGRQIAYDFAKEGATVVAVARRAERLEELAGQVESDGLPGAELQEARQGVARVEVRVAVHDVATGEKEETQYIIFTSGTTGRPKGIEVTAANVARFSEWLREFPQVRT